MKPAFSKTLFGFSRAFDAVPHAGAKCTQPRFCCSACKNFSNMSSSSGFVTSQTKIFVPCDLSDVLSTATLRQPMCLQARANRADPAYISTINTSFSDFPESLSVGLTVLPSCCETLLLCKDCNFLFAASRLKLASLASCALRQDSALCIVDVSSVTAVKGTACETVCGPSIDFQALARQVATP